MRRRFVVLCAPLLALVMPLVSDAGGSAAPAADTDQLVPVDVSQDGFVSATRCIVVPGAAQGDVAVVNITNTQAEGAGWGVLRRFGETPMYYRPSSSQYSSVNFAPSTPPNPNLAFAEVGAQGQLCYDGTLFRNHHVSLDLSAVIPAANVDAVTPRRLLDTRSDRPVAVNSSRCVSVAGTSVGDVAVVNITSTQAAGSGWGALRSSDDQPVFSRPTSSQYSSVNFAASAPPNPNLAVTEIGADGRFCYDGAIASHHVLLDLAAVIPAANVNAVTPTRLLDTRESGGLVAANSSRCVEVVGAGDGDVAMVNITNAQAAGGGWGALRSPSATAVYSRPVSGQYSSVNFAANTPPNPNLALAVIEGGEFCYDGAIASHHVALDLAAIIPAANVSASESTRILDTRTECRSDAYLDVEFAFSPQYVSSCLLSAWAQNDRQLAQRFAEPAVIDQLFSIGTGAGWTHIGCGRDGMVEQQPTQVWPDCLLNPSPEAGAAGWRQIVLVFWAYDDGLVVASTM